MRKMYLERKTDLAFDTYVYIDNQGNQVCVDISVGGGELFELPEHVLNLNPDMPTLSNSIFLWMFVIRKYLQDSGESVPLNAPIVIDLAEDKSSEMIEAVSQIQGIQQPMEFSDLSIFLNTDNSWQSDTLRKSLKLFGVVFDNDEPTAPILGFDVHTGGADIVNSNIILDKYGNRRDLSECLMKYIFAITALSFSEIDAINIVCSEHNILLVNSTLDRHINTNDSEHSDNILNINNKQSNQLLAQLGGKRSVDKKHSNFTDIIKLYSLLEEHDCEVNISYNDFADHTCVDSNTSEIGMTEGLLRALALFHIQHPDNPIDFESMPLKQQYDYCRYIADLADRKEGTLSDRLQALHSKYIGGLYTIDTPDYRRYFVRLDSIKLSNGNSISNDSIRLISLPISKLASCLRYADNRPTVTQINGGDIYFDPLPYGEDPFDYRPDFIIDPLAAAPKQHTLKCVKSDFYCDEDSSTAISILPVLSTLMHTDLLEPIIKAELLDYVDYSSVYNCELLSDSPDITDYCMKMPNQLAENNIKVTSNNVGRSIQEKSFIMNSFIHRLLRYFESVMVSEASGASIPRRLLSLADLLCYEYKGVVYVGVADKFESMYEVTPLVPTITISSDRRYSGATEDDFSNLKDCIMVLPKRTVSSITPSTIFNRKAELPTAVRAIVNWLNEQNQQNNEYEDYVSYGLQFTSWDAYLVLQSCSAAGALSSDSKSFFGNTSNDYATITSGCTEDIHAAYLEFKQGIISHEEYIERTQKMCELYITSILTIPLYSLEYVTERNIICNSSEIVSKIDFRFFKNVRLQYSPISIFGTWNDQQNIVTWHTSLLN